MRVLVYGYGNPGRQDDGLGIALVNRLEDWAAERQLEGISFDNNYQLNIEDADAIAEQDLVIFADASEEEIEDFCLSVVDGKGGLAFTTHSASPGYILKLCQELFQKDPLVLLLHIKGYEWEFQEGLSSQAVENLEAAYLYMTELLVEPESLLASLDGLKLC
jgi:hydrogenase maturation protease